MPIRRPLAARVGQALADDKRHTYFEYDIRCAQNGRANSSCRRSVIAVKYGLCLAVTPSAGRIYVGCRTGATLISCYAVCRCRSVGCCFSRARRFTRRHHAVARSDSAAARALLLHRGQARFRTGVLFTATAARRRSWDDFARHTCPHDTDGFQMTTSANPAASGKGAIARWFKTGHLRRALPEQQR